MEILAARGSYQIRFMKSLNELNVVIADGNYNGLIYDKKIISSGIMAIDTFEGIPTYGIDANEQSKKFTEISSILEWMSESNLNRKSKLLAIGGGVVQDIATFTAAVFHRGIDWTYVPTTLLAQSDSCIGGKCGINLENSKNQIGLVYPPNDIYIVDDFLETLNSRDFISGLGEIFKLSLTGEKQFWTQMKSYLDGGLIARQDLVKYSLDAKRIIIEADEFEIDLRRILNYGHTFGHAIESVSDYKIPHGIAVLLGMKIIHKLGISWGVTNKEFALEADRYIDKLLERVDSPLDFNKNSVYEKIKHDKKIRNGVMAFVVPESPGNLRIIKKGLSSNLEEEVKSALAHI
jgi:3-dehydroquinate synthase